MSRQGHIAKKCVRRCTKAARKCSSRCTRYYYVLDIPPGPDGKRKQTWSKGYTTRKEAEQALREELTRRDHGIVLDTQKLTVRAFLERWLDHMAMLGRDERTLERYRELLELHALPTIGGLQLKALQGALVDLYATLLRQGRRDGKPGGLHPRTVGHVHRALHRMLKQAARWQLIARNPAADLELPTVPKAAMVTLTREQAGALLRAAEPRPLLRYLVMLGVATGARLGELLALRWTDVDLDEATLRIGASRRIVNGRMQVKGPKTEAGYRTVVLGPSTVAARDLQGGRPPLPPRQHLEPVPQVRRRQRPAEDRARAHAAALGRVVPGRRRRASLRHRRPARPQGRRRARPQGVRPPDGRGARPRGRAPGPRDRRAAVMAMRWHFRARAARRGVWPLELC